MAKWWWLASFAHLEKKVHDLRHENSTLHDDLDHKIIEIKNLHLDLNNTLSEIKSLNEIVRDNNLYKLNESVEEKMFEMKLFNDKLGDKISEFKEIDIDLKHRYQDLREINEQTMDKFLCNGCREMKYARKLWFGFN